MSGAASFGIGPNLANYGSRGKSASLTSFGASEQGEATAELGAAAGIEQKRNASNEVAAAQRKQGNSAMASTVGGLAGGAVAGAEFGSAAGPWGTLIGGVVGALAGNYF